METIERNYKVGNSKGYKRVWLQDMQRAGWPAGTPVNIMYNDGESIVITKNASGKRKVSAPSHGGVLDLSGKVVFDWWQSVGSPARVDVRIMANRIEITPA